MARQCQLLRELHDVQGHQSVSSFPHCASVMVDDKFKVCRAQIVGGVTMRYARSMITLAACIGAVWILYALWKAAVLL